MISPDITERFILLSFDIEEFDIAGEYGLEVEGEALFAPSLLGLQRLLALLEKLGMVATFFVTVAFASRYPALIAQMAKTHEIASHGMRHDGVNDEDYKASRMALEAITGKPVHGFRCRCCNRRAIGMIARCILLFCPDVITTGQHRARPIRNAVCGKSLHQSHPSCVFRYSGWHLKTRRYALSATLHHGVWRLTVICAFIIIHGNMLIWRHMHCRAMLLHLPVRCC